MLHFFVETDALLPSFEYNDLAFTFDQLIHSRLKAKIKINTYIKLTTGALNKSTSLAVYRG